MNVQKQLNIECPCCNKQINVQLGVVNVTPHVDMPDGPNDWRQTLTEAQIAVVESAKTSGLFEQFCDAVNVVKSHQQPRFPERFFVTWFNTAGVLKKVPQSILNKLISRFGGRIDLWQSNGIAAVLASGELQLFIPSAWLVGVALKANLRTNADSSQVNEWVYTKYGLVAFRGAMFESMKVKSRGEFVTVRGL
jgi:hypothetical protein